MRGQGGGLQSRRMGTRGRGAGRKWRRRGPRARCGPASCFFSLCRGGGGRAWGCVIEKVRDTCDNTDGKHGARRQARLYGFADGSIVKLGEAEEAAVSGARFSSSRPHKLLAFEELTPTPSSASAPLPSHPDAAVRRRRPSAAPLSPRHHSARGSGGERKAGGTLADEDAALALAASASAGLAAAGGGGAGAGAPPSRVLARSPPVSAAGGQQAFGCSAAGGGGAGGRISHGRWMAAGSLAPNVELWQQRHQLAEVV